MCFCQSIKVIRRRVLIVCIYVVCRDTCGNDAIESQTSTGIDDCTSWSGELIILYTQNVPYCINIR